MPSTLDVRQLQKDYTTADGSLSILRGLDLSMDPGEALAITGPSGSGKSTLLYLIGALDTPSAGTVTLAGQDPFQLNESQQAQFRIGKSDLFSRITICCRNVRCWKT